MPLIRYALFAAAASLIGGVACAQGAADQAAAPPADTSSAPPTAGMSSAMPPATDKSAVAPTGAGTETSAIVNGQTVQVIASQPVPDTPENRAKYGQPLSHAGKRSKPIGN